MEAEAQAKLEAASAAKLQAHVRRRAASVLVNEKREEREAERRAAEERARLVAMERARKKALLCKVKSWLDMGGQNCVEAHRIEMERLQMLEQVGRGTGNTTPHDTARHRTTPHDRHPSPHQSTA